LKCWVCFLTAEEKALLLKTSVNAGTQRHNEGWGLGRHFSLCSIEVLVTEVLGLFFNSKRRKGTMKFEGLGAIFRFAQWKC
jgi:hypothetical protein